MIERPPGSKQWRLRVYLAPGKYASETFNGSERDARKALAKLEVAAMERKAPAPSKATTGQLLEDWWEQKAWNGAGARRQARGDLDRYLIPRLGHIKANRLDDTHIAELYRRLQTPGSNCWAKSGRPLGPATVRRLHVNLHMALEWGVRKRRIPFNPASNLDVPANPPTKVRGPEATDIDKLLAQAELPLCQRRRDLFDDAFPVFVRLAVATGRRREDILGIQAMDLRIDEGAILFERRVVHAGVGEGVVIEDLDKNGRAARLDIDAVTMERVAALLTSRQRLVKELGGRWRRDAFLFSDDPEGREPWRPDSTSREFRKLRDRAGLSEVTLHSLRHAHVTQLLEAGLDIEAVAMRVGDDPTTIYRVYSHHRRGTDRRAANIMDRMLNGATTGLTVLDGGMAGANKS